MSPASERTGQQGDRSRRGFTLLELMIVVVITGVLAAIAIPTFTGYVYKSRTSEATQFLGQIKLRQEEYRSEFGRYAQIGGAAVEADATWAPADPSAMSGAMPFPGTVDVTDWSQLGANPGGQVRFAYRVFAGTPVDDMTGSTWAFPRDHYFVAQAQSDLDADSVECTFELTSHTNIIWFAPAKGWE